MPKATLSLIAVVFLACTFAGAFQEQDRVHRRLFRGGISSLEHQLTTATDPPTTLQINAAATHMRTWFEESVVSVAEAALWHAKPDATYVSSWNTAVKTCQDIPKKKQLMYYTATPFECAKGLSGEQALRNFHHPTKDRVKLEFSTIENNTTLKLKKLKAAIPAASSITHCCAVVCSEYGHIWDTPMHLSVFHASAHGVKCSPLAELKTDTKANNGEYDAADLAKLIQPTLGDIAGAAGNALGNTGSLPVGQFSADGLVDVNLIAVAINVGAALYFKDIATTLHNAAEYGDLYSLTERWMDHDYRLHPVQVGSTSKLSGATIFHNLKFDEDSMPDLDKMREAIYAVYIVTRRLNKLTTTENKDDFWKAIRGRATTLATIVEFIHNGACTKNTVWVRTLAGCRNDANGLGFFNCLESNKRYCPARFGMLTGLNKYGSDKGLPKLAKTATTSVLDIALKSFLAKLERMKAKFPKFAADIRMSEAHPEASRVQATTVQSDTGAKNDTESCAVVAAKEYAVHALPEGPILEPPK